MKKNCKYGSWWFVVLCFSVFVFSCRDAKKTNEQTTVQTKEKEVYYCPMHPEIQQDHPGKCPKPECMGMELVKKVSENVMNTILKPVNESVLASTQTIHPMDTTIPIEIVAQGFVDYDNCSKKNIASTVSGRIEKLYIKTNFQPVRQGEKVMEVYSPELVTAQENLIYLLSNESDENSIVNAAKEKLRLLGMSESQIKMVCTNKKLQRTVTVFSKWSGVVREEIQNNNQGKTMNDNASSSGQYASNSFSVKEGMYVHEGQTIFNVVDPKKPVVMLQVKAKDIAAIRIKQQVILKTSDSISIKGKVDFIEPLLGNSKTTFIRVILEEKQTNLKTRMLMTGKIETEGVEGIFIPASAVIDAGRNKFVWVKKEGHFTAKKIEVGVTTKDWIEVYDGISEKDEIAVQGHYLLDSESFLKTEEDATE